MKKSYYIFFLFITGGILLLACENKTERKVEAPAPEVREPEVVAEEEGPTEEEQLYQEIISIHDRTMLRMGEIRKLSLQLTDSIENTGVNPMYQEEAINMYRNRLKELKEADEAMRQWMRKFGSADDSLLQSAKNAYLLKEKEKIQEVEQQVNNAISDAREVLQK